MKKVLFIDRDGTILVEPPDEQVDSFAKMRFLPGVISALRKIAAETDYELVMVTNQDGLGTRFLPEKNFWPVHNFMLQVLAAENIRFAEVLIDRTFPADLAPTRKPGTGMLTKYLRGKYDLGKSFVIGDRLTDIQLAKNLGCQAIYIHTRKHKDAALTTTDWHKIHAFLACSPRQALVRRKSNETEITVQLDLDGTGRYNIRCRLGFFKHMLELFSRHSGFDLDMTIRGDLHVDEHHTVEDTAIALGLALKQALADKKGMERYGFVLPMDDALAQVAVDLSGRAALVWKVRFKREKIGDMPTEMFYHFFKSFSDQAGCNLHIRAQGDNEHHIIEAVFKATGRALRMAVQRDVRNRGVPSTKGIL
jgi:imidazoleglycerol-phosphate dehydratase / histidinol-phosphatase